MSANPAIVDTAEAAGLIYVSDSIPGISRCPHGAEFVYVDTRGKTIRDAKELERIRALAIPPAYQRVWICPDPKGHIQATGFDARGRKQYRYHPRFREVQEENKFGRMLLFGRLLPKLRKQVDRDLMSRGLPKRKVLAVVVYLLERSLVRVGNEEYARENKSFGLTTMRNRHVRVEGANIEFNFLGKSKVKHRLEIHDRRLANLIKKFQELPGQELFQYLDDEGQVASISSADVNSYLQEVSAEHLTAKDFRTWWGTLLALIDLALAEPQSAQQARKRTISSAMKNVSKRLGNTPSICRKCYVHPAVLQAFESGTLRKVFSPPENVDVEDLIPLAEAALLKLLKSAG